MEKNTLELFPEDISRYSEFPDCPFDLDFLDEQSFPELKDQTDAVWDGSISFLLDDTKQSHNAIDNENALARLAYEKLVAR